MSDVPLSSEQAPLRRAPRYPVLREETWRAEHRDVEVGGRARPLESSPEGDGRVAIEAVTYWLRPEGFLLRNPTCQQ